MPKKKRARSTFSTRRRRRTSSQCSRDSTCMHIHTYVHLYVYVHAHREREGSVGCLVCRELLDRMMHIERKEERKKREKTEQSSARKIEAGACYARTEEVLERVGWVDMMQPRGKREDTCHGGACGPRLRRLQDASFANLTRKKGRKREPERKRERGRSGSLPSVRPAKTSLKHCQRRRRRGG